MLLCLSLGRYVLLCGSQDRTRTYTDGVKVRCASLHHSTVSTHLQTQQSHIDRAAQRLIGERLWRWQALASPACVAITFSALTNNGANRRKTSSRKQAFGRFSKGSRAWATWLRRRESHPRSSAYEAELNTHSPRNILPRLGRHAVRGLFYIPLGTHTGKGRKPVRSVL